MDPKSIIVVSDTSIRNNITMSILHIYSCSNNIKKTIHYTVNVTSTEVELFAIRCGINQAIHIPDINHICYDLRLKCLSNRTTLVLSNTRELNRELFYKLVYLI